MDATQEVFAQPFPLHNGNSLERTENERPGGASLNDKPASSCDARSDVPLRSESCCLGCQVYAAPGSTGHCFTGVEASSQAAHAIWLP